MVRKNRVNTQSTSLRRQLLDTVLRELNPPLRGNILDIGGENVGYRGHPLPIEKSRAQRTTVNLDPDTGPDVVADAHSLPFPDDTFDMALLLEVLEHVYEPERAVSEAARVTKVDGFVIISMPYIYPYHPDPVDYVRWSPEKIEAVAVSHNLVLFELRKMGNLLSTTYDLFRAEFIRRRQISPLIARLGLTALNLLRPLALLADQRLAGLEPITFGGFLMVLKKK